MRAWAAGTLHPQPAANCLVLLVFLFSPKNFGNRESNGTLGWSKHARGEGKGSRQCAMGRQWSPKMQSLPHDRAPPLSSSTNLSSVPGLARTGSRSHAHASCTPLDPMATRTKFRRCPSALLTHIVIHGRSALADNPGRVEDLAVAFYRLNEDPKVSPNLLVQAGDDYSFLMDLLDDQRAFSDVDLALSLLRMLKVLSRKESNRVNMEQEDVDTITKYIRHPESTSVQGEAASIMLNACYEASNVKMAIKANAAVECSWLLDSDSEEAAANATGALQSMSYQEEGRVHIREVEILEHIFPLLSHTNVKVRTRAVGVIHNMSSDVPSIAVIRTGGALTDLVKMLSDPQVAICSSAAGAIQNLSREQASKDLLVEIQGVPPLTDLLFGADVQTQVPTRAPASSSPTKLCPRREAQLTACAAGVCGGGAAQHSWTAAGNRSGHRSAVGRAPGTTEGVESTGNALSGHRDGLRRHLW